MNSSPFARLSITQRSQLVAAIYPACLWELSSPWPRWDPRAHAHVRSRGRCLEASFGLGEFRSNLTCHRDRSPTQPLKGRLISLLSR